MINLRFRLSYRLDLYIYRKGRAHRNSAVRFLLVGIRIGSIESTYREARNLIGRALTSALRDRDYGHADADRFDGYIVVGWAQVLRLRAVVRREAPSW